MLSNQGRLCEDSLRHRWAAPRKINLLDDEDLDVRLPFALALFGPHNAGQRHQAVGMIPQHLSYRLFSPGRSTRPAVVRPALLSYGRHGGGVKARRPG